MGTPPLAAFALTLQLGLTARFNYFVANCTTVVCKWHRLPYPGPLCFPRRFRLLQRFTTFELVRFAIATHERVDAELYNRLTKYSVINALVDSFDERLVGVEGQHYRDRPWC